MSAVLLWFVCLNVVFATVPESPLQRYQEFLNATPSQERTGALEMGLNSDQGEIFYFALKTLLAEERRGALPVMKNLLLLDSLAKDRRRLLYFYYCQLLVLGMSPLERGQSLIRIISRRTSVQNPDLLEWAVKAYGDTGQLLHPTMLARLERHPYLRDYLKVLRLKMDLSQKYREPISLVIATMQHHEPEIRAWGMRLSLSVDDPRVADFLSRWYEQYNLVGGRFEFEQLELTLKEHRQRYPKLYSGH